jgi:hypothetical protein
MIIWLFIFDHCHRSIYLSIYQIEKKKWTKTKKYKGKKQTTEKNTQKKLDTIATPSINYTDPELFWKNLTQYRIYPLIRIQHYTMYPHIWLVNRILPPQYLLSVEPQTPVLPCLAAHIFLPKNWRNAESCPRDSSCGCASRGGFWSSWYSAERVDVLEIVATCSSTPWPLNKLGIHMEFAKAPFLWGLRNHKEPRWMQRSLLKLGSSCQKLVVRWSLIAISQSNGSLKDESCSNLKNWIFDK